MATDLLKSGHLRNPNLKAPGHKKKTFNEPFSAH